MMFPRLVDTIYRDSGYEGDLNSLKALVENAFTKNEQPSLKWLAVELRELSNLPKPRAVSYLGNQDDIERFAYKFSDKNGTLGRYVNFVRNDIINAYGKPIAIQVKYYAPYFAVVQSSGYGKSRVLLEAGLKHLNTVYCCVRSDDLTGYPKADERMKRFLVCIKTDSDAARFLCCCYFVAKNYILKAENERKAGKSRTTLPLSDFWRSSPDRPFEDFWTLVVDFYEDLGRQPNFPYMGRFTNEQIAYQNLKGTLRPENGLLNGCVLSELVVVFDDSRALHNTEEGESIFQILRRALHKIGSKNMVLVFVDTLPTLSNSVPKRSDVKCFDRPTYIFRDFPHFYELLTYDEVAASSFTDDFESHQHYIGIFGQGRPLWKTMFGRPEQFEFTKLSEMIWLARKKLSDSSNAKLATEESKIATLAVRIGIKDVADNVLASALMSSHMGTCTCMYLDDNRVRMIVQYPPEPVLGEAACHNLHGSDKDIEILRWDPLRIREILIAFLDRCISGLVSAGTIDQILARVILSLSYDYAVLESIQSDKNTVASGLVPMVMPTLFSKPITVQKLTLYLISKKYIGKFGEWSFLGKVLQVDPQNKMSFGEGLVSFTNWLTLQSINQKMSFKEWQDFLKACFDKRTAVILPLGQKGADLLIPIKLGSVYSFILIQVKNRVDMSPKTQQEAAGIKLTFKNCFGCEFNAGITEIKEEVSNEGKRRRKSAKRSVPSSPPQYLAIYMEIGPSDLSEIKTDMVKKLHSDLPNHLMLFGFDSYEIASHEDLKETFKLLCRREVENVNLTTRLEVLRKMNSLCYRFSKQMGCMCTGGCQTKRCGCRKRNVPCTRDCLCIKSDCANHKK